MTYDQMLSGGCIYVLHVKYKKRIDRNSRFDLYKPFKRIPIAFYLLGLCYSLFKEQTNCFDTLPSL